MLNIHVLKFDWVQNSCVKKHELGFILVDLNKLGYKYDLFILTSQAKQVLYVNDHIQTKWYILCHMPTKSNPNQINEDEVNNIIEYPQFTKELSANVLLYSTNGYRVIYACNNKGGIWLQID